MHFAHTIASLILAVNLTAFADDAVIADFEGNDYGQWVATGSAFGSGPAQGTLPNQVAASGYAGKGLVNSYLGGDESTGELLSPEFVIEKPYIDFLIAGGNHPGETCINLLVSNNVVRTATGKDSEALEWASWDVGDLKGQPVRLQIVDKQTGSWGHIDIDQIVQSTEKKGEAGPPQATADKPGETPAGDVIADFESTDYGKWEVTGTAFGAGPAEGTSPGQMTVSGFVGNRLANSYQGGDEATGSLTSPEFRITRPYIVFLIGGGAHPGEACINLLVNGKVVRTATGKNDEQLNWATWDVSALKGKSVRIQILDEATGSWGHINTDHILQADEKKGALLSNDARGLPAGSETKVTYTEPYRPQFHFTPAQNWCNDPNGLIYYEGEYHLFYQYNPFDKVWGRMNWGHAVSTDLVHWQHLPVAIEAERGASIFSGSIVVDAKNTSGFGKAGKPPLVAVYTGHRPSPDLQTQCLAYSTDRGRTWTKYAKNPVLDIGSGSFRDPKVFWHPSSGKWIMVVAHSDDHKISFYGSENLKEWKELGKFGPAGNVAGKWECPDMFELPVDNQPGTKRWVLHVGVGAGAEAGGSGGQYFIGDFNGKTFKNDNADGVLLSSDYGKDDYAAASWANLPATDTRRLWMGWMNNWEYAEKIPTQPWRGAMTIPRVLGLKKFGDKVRLTQRPADELRTLRAEHEEYRNVVISPQTGLTPKMSGDALEIVAEFALDKATEVGVKVRKRGEEQTVIGYNVSTKRLFVDRNASGKTDFSEEFPSVNGGPLSAVGGRIKLHIFVDRASVEVFGNGGETVVTDQIFPSPESQGIEFYSKGNSSSLIALDLWKLNSIWGK